MTKYFITIAAAAIAACGFTAAAQDRAAAGAAPEQSDKMRRAATPREYAFEGVLLSMDQQAKIDAINAEFDAKCAKGKCVNNCDPKKCPYLNCRKDSCTARPCPYANDSCVAQPKGPRGPRHGHGPRGQFRNGLSPEYIAKVKEVLTPEQYTLFLENIVNMPYNMRRDRAEARQGNREARSLRCEARRDARKVKAEARKDARKAKAEARKDAKKAKADAKKAARAAKKDLKKVEADVK